MWYTYVTCNSDNQCFHSGVCLDMEATIKFYNGMICIKTDFKLHKLVYLEGYETKEDATTRFKELSTTPQKQIIEIISAVNPELIEYIIGENIQI